MLWFKLIIPFLYSELCLQFTCQRHVGLVIILWYFIFVTLKKEHLAPNLKFSFCLYLLTFSLCPKSLGSLVAPSGFLLLAEECDSVLQWISSFLDWSQTHGQDCLLFLRHSETSSSRGKTNHSLTSLLQYLLLPKQKSGQEQDFLLIIISLELLMSRSRQGMAKVNNILA